VDRGEGIDWANAEALAFASLVTKGTPIRLSGEDSRRGTFSQRHSVWVDTENGTHWTPLANLAPGQAPFTAYDSMLSEAGVLGFEYGYSLVSPRWLVLWEAQYGDFANGAQVIIDQFVASGEAKWHRPSGLVLLLPHGYEGQGPDHSTGRLERFLQLCAEDNMEVANPSTPAQYFHLLRRQALRDFRKPLVILTPKSLLRHPRAVSRLPELASGFFREVIGDEVADEGARRILLCSGKIYYELLERREKLDAKTTALVRLEQLYPFPEEALAAAARSHTGAEEWMWVQEEPENMGAWSFVRPRLEAVLGREVGCVGRPAAASPATGFLTIHKSEQQEILGRALPDR
jgi:2-oxoglutarate dehydrogenase E1 component